MKRLAYIDGASVYNWAKRHGQSNNHRRPRVDYNVLAAKLREKLQVDEVHAVIDIQEGNAKQEALIRHLESGGIEVDAADWEKKSIPERLLGKVYESKEDKDTDVVVLSTHREIKGPLKDTDIPILAVSFAVERGDKFLDIDEIFNDSLVVEENND